MENISTPSTVTKILSIAGKLAPIAGAVHGFLGDPMGDGRGFAGAPQFIYDRVIQGQQGPGLLQGHIGNPLITTKIALEMPDKYPIMAGVAAGIGGWIAEKVGASVDAGMPGQIIGGFGRFFKKYGFTAAASSIIAAWVYLSPYNDAGTSDGYTAGRGTTASAMYSRGRNTGSTNTYYQVRAAANIRNSTGPVDVYPT
jgi:hypothetical protein